MRALPMARLPSCLGASNAPISHDQYETSLSRRGLMGAGAAALFTGAAWGQQISGADANSAASSVTAAEDANRHLTIAVTINGRGPYRFVVDTGADRSVLSDTVAADLGLAKQTKVLVEGVVRTVPAETVHIGEISFGSVRRTDMTLPVLPRAWLGADGFLGLDMIDRYRVTFDFRRGLLSVEEPLSPWLLQPVTNSEDRVIVDGRHGHLRAVNCRIDGISVTVFIDTGAEVSVANCALLAALSRNDPQYYIRSAPIEIAGVTGGTISGAVMSFKHMKIKDLHFTNGTLAVVDMQIFKLWGLADRPAILIGMNFLRQFDRVTIDYRRHTFDFEVSQTNWYLAQRNLHLG